MFVSWQAAYRKLMLDDYLDQLRPEDGAKKHDLATSILSRTRSLQVKAVALGYEDRAAGLVGLTLGLATQRRIDRASMSVEQWARLIRDYLQRLPPGGSSAPAV